MEVDCRALRANYDAVTQRIPAGCRTLPMVKADAYGIGATLAVRALAPLGPYGFGVATLEEARGVRDDGWDGRIVVFTPTLPADVAGLVSACCEPVVGNLSALATCLEAGLQVHVEIDTGMGRFGFPWSTGPDGWPDRIARMLSDAGGRGGGGIGSVFTHFHSAETDEAATREQWRRFEAAVDALREVGVDPGLVHAANSAAAMEYPGVVADVVRPGVWLYGVEVCGRRPQPVAAVRARVLTVRDVDAGSTVSYGATWTASSPARLATIGIGYADGLPRCLSGKGRALIHGRPAPFRGVVTMDTTVVDVTGRDDVEPGDAATVLGRDGAGEITPEELAAACGTIAYEILTGWSTRVPKIGLDGDA
ncbi:MAG: alanine racemase [Gemmatimonadales bacterium]|jgi:alanine racemase